MTRSGRSEVEAMAENWKSSWRTFTRSLETRHQQFQAEMRGAWGDLAELHRHVQQAFTEQNIGTRPGSYTAGLAVLKEAGRALLQEPLEQYQHRRPIRRALSAIEELEVAVEDLVRQLPESLSLSRGEFADQAKLPSAPWWLKGLSGWRDLGQPLCLRRLLLDHFLRETRRRAHVDGAFQLLLARASLELREPWQIFRHRMQGLLTGNGFKPERAAEEEWHQWRVRSDAMGQEALGLLEDYETWANDVPVQLGRAIWPGAWRFDLFREWSQVSCQKRRQANLSFWAREHRAVAALLDLELSFRSLATEALRVTTEELASLRHEHEELQRALAATIEWLNIRSAAASDFEPPVYDIHLQSAEERAEGWIGQLSLAITQILPEKVEAFNPRKTIPSFRSTSRNLEPRKVYLSALMEFGKPRIATVIDGITQVNLGITREMEHARQVIEYGLETSQTDGDSEGEVLAEAIDNARTLLLGQSKTKIDEEQALSRCIEALVIASWESYASLEISRIGLTAHLTRQQGSRFWDEIGERSRRAIRAGSQRLRARAQQLFNWLLLQIGWRLPTRSLLTPVVKRAALAQVLEVVSSKRDLPRIYRHLFRLAPVEDRRFLVGRDEELRGFEEAVLRWEQGHFGATLLVGARGSGKTSLLNCFASSFLAEQTLVRGQFSQRLTTHAEMQTFLRSLFRFSDDTDLVLALAAKRRVVVIEEFERTFLRTVNGFEALRSLLQLIYPTAASTLWILSLNDDAFRYLDLAVNLGRYFSHRINAMSIKPHDLIHAILQRHNLSGLKLSFAPPPPEDPRVSRLRKAFGLERDSERLFFEALYEQSEGVFRSAFELWQACIERVERGVVEMRQPLAPNFRSLREELKQSDHFTLVAILQHGSLTETELAEVLCEKVEVSRLRLDRLRALEILEPDPVHPGVRINAEARRFVLDTLLRVNLL